MSFAAVIGAFWLLALMAYGTLLLYRSLVGLHEDDSLHLSAGEVQFDRQQGIVLRRIAALDAWVHNVGLALLFASALVVALIAVELVRALIGA
jgi:hypothetical protein